LKPYEVELPSFDARNWIIPPVAPSRAAWDRDYRDLVRPVIDLVVDGIARPARIAKADDDGLKQPKLIGPTWPCHGHVDRSDAAQQ
jgi:hypothetical protein